MGNVINFPQGKSKDSGLFIDEKTSPETLSQKFEWDIYDEAIVIGISNGEIDINTTLHKIDHVVLYLSSAIQSLILMRNEGINGDIAT